MKNIKAILNFQQSEYKETDLAILTDDYGWLPKSQITAIMAHDNGMHIIIMAEWLARKKSTMIGGVFVEGIGFTGQFYNSNDLTRII